MTDLLKGAIDLGSARAPETVDEIKFSDEQRKDEATIGIILEDLRLAEKHVQSKARPQEWDDIDNVYRAIVKPVAWDGDSGKLRAHLSMPLVLEVIESILPQIFLGFFSDKTRPFTLVGKGKTTQPAARAIGRVLEWAVKSSGFKEEIRKALKTCLQYGTCITKWGWKTCVERNKTYSRDADNNVVSTTNEDQYSIPTFENCELDRVLADPAVRSHDIRAGRFVIHQSFPTVEDIDELRGDDNYKNIPTRAALKELLAAKAIPTTDNMLGTKVETWRTLQAARPTDTTNSNPVQNPLELLEHQTKDRIAVVLVVNNRCLLIRDTDNEADCITFNSCAFIDILKAFYGLGIAYLLKGEQKLEAGVVNKWLDALDLALSPTFNRKNGTGIGSQNIQTAPGKIINTGGELEAVAVPSVTAEALNALQNSEARARRRVGANFGPDMPNQAMRTAEGVQEFTSGIQVRTQYFIEQFADMVFIPTLEAFISMAKDNLTTKDIDKILTEADGAVFEGADYLDIYNGSYGIEVLTSTKLAGRRAMLAMLPSLMQLFSAAPVQQAFVTANKKIDWEEFVEECIELTGWDSPGLVVDMTPEDMQRALAQNPAAIRNQGLMQLEGQKAQNAQELEQTKGDVRGGLQVVKHILEQSGAHDEAQRNMLTSLLSAPQAPLANQAPNPGVSNTPAQ